MGMLVHVQPGIDLSDIRAQINIYDEDKQIK